MAQTCPSTKNDCFTLYSGTAHLLMNSLSRKAQVIVVKHPKLIYLLFLPLHFSEGNIKNGRTGLKRTGRSNLGN